MPQSSHSQIATGQAARIAKRLLNHWKHKFDVSESETLLQIFMPTAEIQLSPDTAHLNVAIIVAMPDADLPRLEQVVLDHLIRMGQEELSAEWQRSE